jgi:hypothetical protein
MVLDVAPALPEYGGGLTNFDFSIDDGVEDVLRARTHVCTYAGRNFNGICWFDGDLFWCQPWVYHVPRPPIAASTLVDLMHEVSKAYGYG